jgi:hypothetical protein
MNLKAEVGTADGADDADSQQLGSGVPFTRKVTSARALGTGISAPPSAESAKSAVKRTAGFRMNGFAALEAAEYRHCERADCRRKSFIGLIVFGHQRRMEERELS